jgi:hypothetical protein
MYSRSDRAASTLFPLVLGGTLLVSAGPVALRTVIRASLFLAQICLELCQIGLAVLRVCGL